MLEFLTVVAVLVLLFFIFIVTAAWLILRRIRRSRLVATGAHLLAEGTLVLLALRPRPTPNRAAALQGLPLPRGPRVLRQRVIEARGGAPYLGDVPEVLPRLE